MAKKAALKGPLESASENKVVSAMKKLGWKAYKLNGMGQASKPDRLFIGPHNTHVFVEFKREGEFPTVLQAEELLELYRLGHSVAVCVGLEDFLKVRAAMETLKENGHAQVPIFWSYWKHRNKYPA